MLDAAGADEPAAPLSKQHPAVLCMHAEGVGSIVEMAQISDPGVRRWQPLSADDGGISRLGPLLSFVPNIATAKHVASTRHMEVVINGPLAKAKGQEGYRLVTMAGGKPSHGTLLEPSALTRIVCADMLFQMASFAVGQKHMADIQRELEEIKATVQSIAEFQQNERLSSLTSIIRYVSEVAGAALAGEAPPEGLKAVLEMHHRELLKLEDFLMIDIKHGIDAILSVQDPDMFGTDGARKAIAAHLARLSRHYEEAFLAIRARASNLQLAAMSNCVGEQLRTERSKDIWASLQRLKEDGQFVTETTTRMRQRIGQLSAMTDFDTTISQRKLNLLQRSANS
ncbi:hypothetical protein [Burkholderia sp. Ac-20353]|uniref:hypothetical protein n=1 Tax=Burkholderia sp. Ac-20353 TaxID=2703894 RepID=UPI00197C1E41|nr:hypothetical protein [Burkholderia sp. Ac-20353]MBN3788797.1 hypothetical protein [Burkholderia sp. Ac-20353]